VKGGFSSKILELLVQEKSTLNKTKEGNRIVNFLEVISCFGFLKQMSCQKYKKTRQNFLGFG